MAKKYSPVLALDVGEKRIGVAIMDGDVAIPVILPTVEMSETTVDQLLKTVRLYDIEKILVGFPRNQSGEETAQTNFVKNFLDQFPEGFRKICEFRDESLTSVLAEERLIMSGKSYQKGDIDAMAAYIILEDYIREGI